MWHGEVPVGIGTDGGFNKHTATFEDTARAYIPSDDDTRFNTEVGDGQALLRKLYDRAPERGLQLLCISSLSDAARFAREHRQLFAAKTKTVTIMGGVEHFEPSKDDEEKNGTGIEEEDGTLLDNGDDEVEAATAAAIDAATANAAASAVLTAATAAAEFAKVPRSRFDLI